MDKPTKKCATCGETKPTSAFWKCKPRKDGLQTSCKTCQGVANRTRTRTGYNRRHYSALRRTVMANYGDKCACCSEGTLEFLAIDHIDGGGNQHRTEVGGGAKFLRWLRDNGYPAGFQILCHNCNLAKGFFGNCPHQADEATLAAMRERRTAPRQIRWGSPQVCPVCQTEFVRSPSAKAITCSYRCMAVRQTELGTRPRRQGRSKLTDEQRLEIRRRCDGGESGLKLAAEFGVSKSQISRIVRGVVGPSSPQPSGPVPD